MVLLILFLKNLLNHLMGIHEFQWVLMILLILNDPNGSIEWLNEIYGF